MTQTIEISISYWNGKPRMGWLKTANAAGITLKPMNPTHAFPMFQYLSQWKHSKITTCEWSDRQYRQENCTIEMS